MKVIKNNVLYVGMLTQQWEGTTYYRAQFCDDAADYSMVEIRLENSQINSLPAPKSRVDLEFDITQRNNKVYLQNPVLKILAPK